MSDSESSRRAFDDAISIISEDYKQLPDADELIAKITRKFTMLYEDPLVNDLKKVVGDVNIDDARSLLFKPTVLQRRMYPVMLRSDSGLPSSLRLTVLSLVYTLHRKKWVFLRDFILADGLNVLSSLLLEPNLYARGQVCEIFLSIIDSDQDSFDWFVPLTDETNDTKKCDVEMREILYCKLLGVYKASLLDNLIANSCNYSGSGSGAGSGESEGDNSFPGGGARCLQIMAFWLSWVRVHFSPQQQLQLSGPMLKHLQGWAEVAEKNWEQEKIARGSEVVEEEREEEDESGEAKLARTLAEDFGGAGEAEPGSEERSKVMYFIAPVVWPESEARGGSTVNDEEHVWLVEQCEASVNSDTLGDTTNTGNERTLPSALCPVASTDSLPPVPLCSSSAQHLKDTGNEQFFAGKYFLALAYYSLGLHQLQSASSPNSSTSLLASLHYNSASCYWKLAAADVESHPRLLTQCLGSQALRRLISEEGLLALVEEMKSSSKSQVNLWMACSASCQKCLQVQPSHRRALHREASCLQVQEKYAEAVAVIEKGLAAMETDPGCNPPQQQQMGNKKKQIDETAQVRDETSALHDLRRLCSARLLVSRRSDEESCGSEQLPLGVNSRVGGVFSKLRVRQEREERRVGHAWNGIDCRENGEALEGGEAGAGSSPSYLTARAPQSTVKTTKRPVGEKKEKKKKKTKKAVADPVALQKKCLKLSKALRETVEDFLTAERWTSAEPDDQSEGYRETMTAFNKAVKAVWKVDLSLSQICAVNSMDERLLFAITALLMDDSAGVTTTTKQRLREEVKSCTGFRVAVNFLFSDDAVSLKGPQGGWKKEFLST